ncbi:MAG: hypothetical protein CBE08_003945 [Euryarchaeota archaeon TMED248]|nr:MAG: hypothetical protein CBE08_003945 [Euryarchaeota archaeon TMED248]|tara:strand:- start:6440 stop:11866 length:5427 start_codon:yes stop_codon:yes gene_type:complete
MRKNSTFGIAIFLAFLMAFTPMTPISDLFVEDASASSVSRHIYQFSDGSTEYIALYQNGRTDDGAEISIPKGAEVSDISMTLSGASATGWSSELVETRSDWMEGSAAMTDSRSDTLTLSPTENNNSYITHSLDENISEESDAWYDNGTFSVRQPHTSNASENLFSMQVQKSSSALIAQSQGAILKHHDWLFLSTWSSKQFSNVVKRLYPNNATVESTILLEQASCTLPQQPSSSYYSYYGFRDWTVTDDERLFGILSTYRYHYSSSAPAANHRVLEFDISKDDVWTCLDSYDISPQYNDYTGIAYDASRDVVWVLHNSQRRIVSYEFDEMQTGSYTRGSTIYTYFSSSGSSYECGKTGQQVRGLEVSESTFFMRCQKGSSGSQNKDVLEAWKISGASETLVPQSNTKQINVLGYGLQFDGKRFITVDCSYSSFSSVTLNYREYGTGWSYETIPAPGTTTWYGDTIYTSKPVLSVNMETYWDAPTIGDRVDYWVSADNGTHWESVTSLSTIHFSYPGNQLIWKAQLIGSSAVSWWVNIDYYTSYSSNGAWVSDYFPTGTNVGKVRPEWVENNPLGTTVEVRVSNDNGTNWLTAQNNQEVSFPSLNAGNSLRFEITMNSQSRDLSPSVELFRLWYEEGYPDMPSININGIGDWDWESLQFLNESSISVSDSSIVGTEVLNSPTLVSAINQEISSNGEGDDTIFLSFKAESPGRIKVTDLDVEYNMKTRAIGVYFDGDVAVPDGIKRMLTVKAAAGDDVERVTKTIVELINSNGNNPSFIWEFGDSCSSSTNSQMIALFDVNNCTSFVGSDGILEISMPMRTTWLWDDEQATQALVTVEDETGIAVPSWQTDSMDLKVENDIQLNGMNVFDENGRQLTNFEWLRGGTNISFTGMINFEGSQLTPLPGQFLLRVVGQNVSNSGQPVGDEVILIESQNPGFGNYNLTFQTPMESTPGGMVFYVQAVNLVNGSEFVNPSYNNIRLILDGNSPLVISVSPNNGDELHASLPAPAGQPISLTIQDSVDPPTLVTLHYWLGCRSTVNTACNDYNFDNLPNHDEYQTKTLSSPEIKTGGMNVFQGLIDDSMLTHGQKVSFYVSGSDGQNNLIAMGGGPVCPQSTIPCDGTSNGATPDWSNDLSTYVIREEFIPEFDSSNSSLIGHSDEQPLHPGVPYTAQIAITDGNGWDDIQSVQISLDGSLSDLSTSIFVTIDSDQEEPKIHVESSSPFIAVSNIYSSFEFGNLEQTKIIFSIKFQLTWQFPESYDTDGEIFFLPQISVSDKSCSIDLEVPCNVENFVLSSNAWSLDNDFRFDTMPGHITAVQLRNGMNHYNVDFDETSIGVGQALRLDGRVLFSEDETPAPAGIFDIQIIDYDNQWQTSIREDGYFSMDFLVPASPSGHLDFSLVMSDMPGLSSDETEETPRLRLAVDSESPEIVSVKLDNVLSGGEVSISKLNQASLLVETYDYYGFGSSEIIVHYRIRAGESEISRGSMNIDSYIIFDGKFFWTGDIDFTDFGATNLLPTYQVDIWFTGSDSAGNSFDSNINSPTNPFGTWDLALIGPNIEFSHNQTLIKWSDPSPNIGDELSLNIQALNQGSKGNVTFILESLDSSNNWFEVSNLSIIVNPESIFYSSMNYNVLDTDSGTIEFRILVYLGDVEMDRITIEPLLVKEEVIRDGEALAKQAGDELFGVTLFLIALVSLSFGLWMLVVSRRMKLESQISDDPADQTVEVEQQEFETKQFPSIETQQTTQMIPQALPNPSLMAPLPTTTTMPQASMLTTENNKPNIAPLPPTGLPAGWTMEQWEHFGWKYIEALTK